MLRRVLFIAVFLTLPALASAADWPTAAHDSARSGRTADRVAPPYRVRWAKAWQYENIATTSQLIVAEGRGFVGTLGRDGSLAGKVHAVDVRDGRDLWTYDDLQGGIAHTLTWSPHAGGTVYAATTVGEVVALEAATGKLRWKFVTPLGGFVVNPCVLDGLVLLGSRQGVFYAINETDGTVRWQRDVGFPICHSAAAADGTVYFLDEGLHCHALELADGAPREGWSDRQLPGGSARFYWPVITKEHVLVTVAPPHQYNWGVTDAVLFQEPGVRSRKEGDRFAIGTAKQEAAEQQNVIDFLKGSPHNRVLHCLSRANGRPACTPGVLYTSGSGSECTPPVLDPEGRPIVEYRSWYSLWDSDSWVNPYSALGTLDPATGVVTQLRPKLEGQRVPWGHVWIIADESSALTMAGDQLLVAHQGNFGGFDFTTARTFAGVGQRDTWGGYPALSWSRQEWHGGPRSALTVVDDSVYYVVGGRVIACQGDARANEKPPEPTVVPAVEKVELPPIPDEPRVPTREQIERIFAARFDRKLKIDEARAKPLRAALTKHVAQTLKFAPHGPFYEWRGIAPTSATQYEDVPLIYALAIAEPHLDEPTRGVVVEHLTTLLASEEIYDAKVSLIHEPRNYHQVDLPDARKVALVLIPAIREDLLTTDALMNATGRSLKDLQENPEAVYRDGGRPQRKPSSRPLSLGGVEGKFNDVASRCQMLTRSAGGIRLAMRLKSPGLRSFYLRNFELQLPQYLEEYHRVARSCAENIDAVPGGDQHPSAGGQYRNLGGPYVGQTHLAAIVYWTDLCPELGQILREFAPAETAAIKAWMLRNAQGFYLARWDTPVQEGEVPCPLYLTTQNYFHFFSSVADADFATHRTLVDMPACYADAFYLERLVHAIEASGK